MLNTQLANCLKYPIIDQMFIANYCRFEIKTYNSLAYAVFSVGPLVKVRLHTYDHLTVIRHSLASNFIQMI